MTNRNTPEGRREYERSRPKRSRPDKRRKNFDKHYEEKTFVAIDSEGFSYGPSIVKDKRTFRAHKTFLWGASDRDGGDTWLVKPANKEALSTRDILEWLLDLPDRYENAIFVMFSFNYDVAQALADLPYEKLWGIHKQREWEYESAEGDEDYEPLETKARPVQRRIQYWSDYGISYLKGKQLTLYKMRHHDKILNEKGKLDYVKKIQIFDVFGFFQSSFLQACKGFPGAVRSDEYKILLDGKQSRAVFQPSQLEQVKEYTRTELIVLSRMMTLLRDAMLSAPKPLHLRTWFGAGSIAAAILKLENVKPHFPSIVTKLPATIGDKGDPATPQAWAHHAFFGGRIEMLKQGFTKKRLHGYDISSAYPYVCRDLPSMRNGRWVHHERPSQATVEGFSVLSMVRLKTRGPDLFDNEWPFYPLPYRTQTGSILFPPSVHGIYMMEEVRAAFDFAKVWRHIPTTWGNTIGRMYDGTKEPTYEIELLEAWEFVVGDASLPFAFVQDLFDFRVSQPSDSIMRLVVKLGINSIYGKLAQAVRSMSDRAPALANPHYAAAITAGTRAALLRAALTAPSKIIMLATDGVLSEVPLPLECPKGKILGAWEHGELASGGLFVQSGVYAISDDKGTLCHKSRGIRPANIAAVGTEKTMADWLVENVVPGWTAQAPSLSYPYQSYMTIGASLASRELFEHIGQWVNSTRELDLMNCGSKRTVDKAKGRRRAKGLLSNLPRCLLSFGTDESEGIEIPLSKMSVPEWLEPLVGEQFARDSETTEIIMARFED